MEHAQSAPLDAYCAMALPTAMPVKAAIPSQVHPSEQISKPVSHAPCPVLNATKIPKFALRVSMDSLSLDSIVYPISTIPSASA